MTSDKVGELEIGRITQLTTSTPPDAKGDTLAALKGLLELAKENTATKSEPITDISAHISPKLSQQLETEYGLVWSDTDNRFLPMYRGILGMDDFVVARFKGKMLDIRKDVDSMGEDLYTTRGYNEGIKDALAIFDKHLGEDFIKERGNEK